MKLQYQVIILICGQPAFSKAFAHEAIVAPVVSHHQLKECLSNSSSLFMENKSIFQIL